jgi:hypothetical protein
MRQRENIHPARLTALLWCVAAASGCDDPLTDPALIIGPRIVGARVASAGDPAVAEPTAGEAARIEWLVLSDEPGTFNASVVWCKAAPTVLGSPRCDGTTFAEQTAPGRWGEPITLDFDVPGDLPVGGAWLAWIGICAAGEALFDANDSSFGCPEGEVSSGFYRGFVPGGVPNRNPSLADDRLELDGVPWPAFDATAAPIEIPPGSPCVDLGLPTLLAEQPSSIGFELIGDDREALDNAPDTYAAHPRESLVYTHLAGLSGLDRAFSAIDYDAARLGFDVPYDFTEAAPGPGGTLLDFFLLVRDERGGVDWLERRACLVSQSAMGQ